jgi:SAM-dependent methyltransferase
MANAVSVEKAMLYERYRLPYARELVGGLEQHIGKSRVVADIGAGTGQLARLFADKSTKVYAIEPEAAMGQVASASLARFANVEVYAGVAERTALASDSIDLIVVGNAFHRFKVEVCEEFRRILSEQGWIALVTYSFTDKAFTDALFSELAELRTVSARIEKAWHKTPVEALFGDGRIHTLSYCQSHTEGWSAFFGAACAGIEAPEPTDREFAQFEILNRKVFDTFAVNGEIQIDYETRVSFGRPLREP